MDEGSEEMEGCGQRVAGFGGKISGGWGGVGDDTHEWDLNIEGWGK